MPRPRFAKLDPARQRRILECAGQEFAAHGYAHASLNHIIEALGLNKGVFYYYFDSKADLFGAVVRMAWQAMLPSGSFDVQALDADTFWPRLEGLLRENHERLREQPWLVGIVRQLVSPPPAAGIDADMARLVASVHAWVAGLLHRGQEVGAVRSDLPLDLLLAVVTAADHAADQWMFDRWDALNEADREQMVRRVFGLWRRMADPRLAMPGGGR
jgi:AcrR family transcriptional regulator